MATFPTPDTTPVPTPQAAVQSPGMLGEVGQELKNFVSSRNLIPALVLGGLVGAIPPMLYSKRNRRGAGRYWGTLGTQLGMNELQRPEREAEVARQQARQKSQELGQLMTAGHVSPLRPGGEQLGTLGGVPLGRTPTIAESFADRFKPTAVPPKSGLAETDLGDGTLPPSTTPPPASPFSAMDIIGGMPDTLQNRKYLADMQYKRDLALQESQTLTATNRTIQEGQKAGGYVALPTVEKGGKLGYKAQLPKSGPGSGKPTESDKFVEIEKRRLGRDLTPDEEQAARQSSRGESLDKTLTKDSRRKDAQALRAKFDELDDQVTGEVVRLPAAVQAQAESPETWERAKKDPNLMKQMDIQTYDKIGGLLRKRKKAEMDMAGFREDTNLPNPRSREAAKLSPATGPSQGDALTLQILQEKKRKGSGK